MTRPRTPLSRSAGTETETGWPTRTAAAEAAGMGRLTCQPPAERNAMTESPRPAAQAGRGTAVDGHHRPAPGSHDLRAQQPSPGRGPVRPVHSQLGLGSGDAVLGRGLRDQRGDVRPVGAHRHPVGLDGGGLGQGGSGSGEDLAAPHDLPQPDPDRGHPARDAEVQAGELAPADHTGERPAARAEDGGQEHRGAEDGGGCHQNAGQALRPGKELAGELAHYAAHSPVIPGRIIVVQAGIGPVESILLGEKILLAVSSTVKDVPGDNRGPSSPGDNRAGTELTVLGKPGPG